ncbi:MAG: hypothetical protein K2X77_11740 [Candidatus Obscuribacterales bacterium]|nr:hypothetical protein [Candidatus Obscuribacterales bacterium]
MARTRRRDPALELRWRKLLDRFGESGLSSVQFCKRAGVKYATFALCRKKLSSPMFVSAIGDVSGLAEESKWTKIIESARNHPEGILAYIKSLGIHEKTYYSNFVKYKANHPEWKLSSSDQKPKKPKDNSGTEPNFVELQVNQPTATSSCWNSTIEIHLPSSLIIKCGANLSPEYFASIVSALEAR